MADNFGNIPPERYQQLNGAPGPDETTMTTGDAGKRVACGVITSASNQSRPRARSTSRGSPRPTIGVEWEFALVDAQTRDLSNEAAAVIAEIGENPRVHKELLRNTVEVVTGVCDERRRGDGRPARHPRAGARGSSATAAWSCSARGPTRSREWSAQQLTDAPRYAELIKRTQWWGRQMLIWGVHVHVGVSSANKVMPIIRRC